MDRVRMQKAVFLVTQQGLSHWMPYVYRPYNWGPYSQDLANDLHDCQARRVLLLSYAGGARYGRYVATPAGQDVIDTCWEVLPERTTTYLRNVRSWVTSKDFNTLLKDVYDDYPDFAVKSHWKPR